AATPTWKTSASGIANINSAGVATAVTEGDVMVHAEGGGISSASLPLAVLQGFGWVDQSAAANTIQTLRGVWFVTRNEGWAVGDLGTILHTTDTGKTWNMQVSNSTVYTLNAVSFASPTIGVVVGSAGRILRTTNGGANWIAITASTDGKQLNDVFFQDATRGWIVGNGGVILRTGNGGSTWTRVNPVPTANDLQSVSFLRNKTGTSPPTDP